MEALTAVSIAALTVYDMCKAASKDICITDIKLQAKSGGQSGDYSRELCHSELLSKQSAEAGQSCMRTAAVDLWSVCSPI